MIATDGGVIRGVVQIGGLADTIPHCVGRYQTLKNVTGIHDVPSGCPADIGICRISVAGVLNPHLGSANGISNKRGNQQAQKNGNAAHQVGGFFLKSQLA